MSSQRRADLARPVRIQFTGTSIDTAMAVLPGLYAGKHWKTSTTSGTYGYRYGGVGDKRLSLRRSQMTGFLQGEIPPSEDDYVVQWIDAGASVIDVEADPIPQVLHRPLLFPPDREFIFTFIDYDQRLVHLSKELVHDVAAEHYDIDNHDLRFDHRQRPEAEAIKQWQHALTNASNVLRASDLQSLAWFEAGRDVARAFLAMYPPLLDPLPPALLLPRNARLRRAVEYLHDYPHMPMTVTDIAAVADLSVRALQDAFQRVYGVSPMRYLEDVRLNRVRQDLLHLEPAPAAVADVARRWGFGHLGRFSGKYLARYGEYPRTTLRR